MMLSYIFVAILLVTNVFGDFTCHKGWKSFQGECIKKIDTPMSFGHARETCRSFNGDLMMVKNPDQAKYVAKLFGPIYGWIGVFDEDEDGQFLYVDGNELESFQPWSSGEPNNWRGYERCVAMTGGRLGRGAWNDANCGMRYPFVCAAGACPEGYVHYEPDNMCIKEVDNPESFEEARAICKKDNGDLLMVKNEGQSKFIRQFLNNRPMWMGVSDDNKDGVFTYVDGTPLTSFHPWAHGEPNNWRGDERCVTMLPEREFDRWNDVHCNLGFPFFCSLNENPCPAGWTLYDADRTCVKKFGTPMSFGDARSKCQETEGDLITIKTLAKNRFVLSLLGQGSAWIGTWDDNKDGAFTHIDGTGLGSFRRWNRGEPNNWNNNERCVSMYGTRGSSAGYWNDAFCGSRNEFVCSMPTAF